MCTYPALSPSAAPSPSPALTYPSALKPLSGLLLLTSVCLLGILLLVLSISPLLEVALDKSVC